jgi:hypothetical protein
MRIRLVLMLLCSATMAGIEASQAQAPTPAPTATPIAPPATAPPPASSSPAPARNPAVGSLRRQNRRQFVYEQKQREDAEDAVRSRAQTAPRPRAVPR